MNKSKWIITGVLLAAISCMLFFSKTIYSRNMAVVTGVLPSKGRLTKKERGTGTAEWAEKEYAYSRVNGELISLFVKEGEWVEKGQVLAEIDVSIDDTWEGDEIAKKRLELEMEGIVQKIENTEKEMETIISEAYDIEEVSLYELNKLAEKIEDAVENQEISSRLYDAGGISKEEYDIAEKAVQTLRQEYEKVQNDINKAFKDEIKKADENEANRQRKIEDLQNSIKAFQREMEMKQLDYADLSLKSQIKNRDSMELAKNKYIVAESDGIILNSFVSKGQYISKGQELFEIGVGDKLEIKVSVNKNNTFIKTGDEAEVKNENGSFTGTVKKTEKDENDKVVTIEIEGEKESGGESFNVNFKKESTQIEMLVPNNCINKDSQGHFLLYIKRREGAFGLEYYVARQNVIIGDSDDNNTIIVSGITFVEPVVSLSNKSVSVGETVRVQNEKDFFIQ